METINRQNYENEKKEITSKVSLRLEEILTSSTNYFDQITQKFLNTLTSKREKRAKRG